MKCSFCGENISSTEEDKKKCKFTKDGKAICLKCQYEFPVSVWKNIKKFTVSDLEFIKQCVHIQKGTPWTRWENLGLCDHSITLKGFEYDTSKLDDFEIRFHPSGFGSSAYTARGTITGVFILKESSTHRTSHRTSLHNRGSDTRIYIEEPLHFEPIDLRYHITGMTIFYSFPQPLNKIREMIDHAINDGIDLAVYHEKKRKKEEEKKKEEERKRKEEQKRKEERKRKEEKKKKEEREREEERRRKEKKRYTAPGSELEDAMIRFGITFPYTSSQVKKARNKLLINKKIHPDNGGSKEAFEALSSDYNLLLKFAVENEEDP